MQRIWNVLFDSGLKILNFGISEPGIFEFADIETELFNHRIEAGNTLLRVCLSQCDLIVAEIAEDEIGN